LHRFVVERLGSGIAVKMAFGIGVAIAIGVAAWMLVVFFVSGIDAAHAQLVQGVSWLCLAAGSLVTLGLAADFAERDTTDGITVLLRQRGHEPAAVRRAYLLATVRLIAGTLLVPAGGLSVVAIILSGSPGAVLSRVLLALAIAAYILLLSGVLALCARWAVAIDHRRPRWILIAILVGPELASPAGVEVSGVWSLFYALLDQVAALGVMFG
jgi:hypothetical protein